MSEEKKYRVRISLDLTEEAIRQIEKSAKLQSRSRKNYLEVRLEEKFNPTNK